MKFAGELRLPDVDHPGIPATVLLDDTHLEIVLDGESLGKWSLYDVRARRLISQAFALDLAGEDVTFLAEEPVDFAYRGVELMAQVWAQFKTMRAPQRLLAVRRSRSHTRDSRVAELRQAMEANLEAQRTVPSRVVPPEPAVGSASPPEATPPPTRRPPSKRPTPSKPEEEAEPASREAQPGPEEERLKEDRARLERLQEEAAARDAQRIEVFRLEMARLESQLAEAEKAEAERQALLRKETERLKNEIRALKEAEARSSDSDDDQAKVRAEAARIDSERRQLERLEKERQVAAERLLEEVQARRTELERQERERWQAHRREMERLRVEAEKLEEREELARGSSGRGVFQDPEPVEDESEAPEVELVEHFEEEVDDVEPEEVVDDVEPEEVVDDVEPEEVVDDVEPEEVVDDVEPEEVVDDVEPEEQVGEASDEPSEPSADQPAVVDVPLPGTEPQTAADEKKKSGFVGSVKAAFSRAGKDHEHVFIEASASFGLRRSICSECGFVSIGASE